MIKLGIAFVVAGIFGSGSEFFVRSYLNNVGDLDVVGLYNAGFMMTMTYAGMIFSAMETDYFPRLSGISELGSSFNLTVNNQMEVSLLLISPLLVLFMFSLPMLLPLLLSKAFLPITDMMRYAILAMYLRALNLPMEYIALARGDSRSFLLVEAVDDLLFVAAVIVGYHWDGVTGTGVGLLVSGSLTFLFVWAYTHWKYGFSLSGGLLFFMLLQFPLGVAACYFTGALTGTAYWLVGLSLVLLAAGASYRALRAQDALREYVLRRLRSRFHKN